MRDETRPNYDCMGCRARAFAQIGAYVDDVMGESVQSIHYRSALERLFGERWRLGHERVKEWNSRIRAASARTEAGVA